MANRRTQLTVTTYLS